MYWYLRYLFIKIKFKSSLWYNVHIQQLTIVGSMDELNYEKSKMYWSQVPASLNGMLGGFSNVTTLDIRDSSIFLKKLFKMENSPSKGRVLDCGAGIGRITENLLCKHFKFVDLLERDEKFLEEAKLKFLGTNVENFYCSGT